MDEGWRRVLVIDSGVGGLSVAAAIRAHVPGAVQVYLADNGMFPYGRLSGVVLSARLTALVRDVRARVALDAAVIACNTASTAVLAELRDAVPDLPFVGVVPPLKTAGEISRSRVVALLATEGTARSPYVDRLIADFLPDARVLRPDCRGLAAEAEKKLRGQPVDPAAIRTAFAGLSPADRGAVDTVVLGCTHYPFLEPELTAELGHPARFLDPALPVARRLAQVLAETPTPAGQADTRWDDLVLFTAPDPTIARLDAALRRAGFPRAAQLEPEGSAPAGG
jgi:glutamate racemase